MVCRPSASEAVTNAASPRDALKSTEAESALYLDPQGLTPTYTLALKSSPLAKPLESWTVGRHKANFDGICLEHRLLDIILRQMRLHRGRKSPWEVLRKNREREGNVQQ